MTPALASRPRLLVVAGPNGAGKTTITERGLAHEWFPDGEKLYAEKKGPKAFHVIAKAGHFDLYDLEPYVTEAIDQIRPFFQPILRSNNATMTTNRVATKIRASLPAESP